MRDENKSDGKSVTGTPTDAPPSGWSEKFSSLSHLERKRVGDCPDLRKKLLRRAILGTCSPRSAIKAFCQSCVGYEDIVESVGKCAATACALHAFRPYRDKIGK